MVVRIIIGIGTFIFIAFLGVAVQLFYIKRKTDDRNFLVEYENDIIDYSTKNEYQAYSKLLQNMSNAQSLLGEYGFASVCKPFETRYRTGVPILSLLTEVFEERKHAFDMSDTYIDMILSAIKIAVGNYDSQISAAWKSLRNVFIDFYKGFNWIIATPFVILSYLFTGKNIFKRIASRSVTTIWRIITFFIQLIGVVSGIMTVVLGFDDFYLLIMTWIGS